ncbi:MAG: DNA polymerase IV [Candidatus Methanomethylophilaceae archaeon]|nr:DNA polymerase IV [Candidatus Methanomethylophilaceae archaeon]
MERIIIHVDMDAFYASVEARDDPSLRGKPLIIGAMPDERGVVSTCSYEAREFGVHSAMNIKEAYKLCPDGVFIRPDFEKYRRVSDQIHEIWNSYSTASENIALDEAYLDVTETAGSLDKAVEFAYEIKRRVADEVGLTCSVGVSYCKAAAKTASEEMKPDGLFVIPSPEDFVDLVIDRGVRSLPSVGKRTAEKLRGIGVETVRDLLDRESEVTSMLGKHGAALVRLAHGIDDRDVVPYRPENAKSVSREITFQANVTDFDFLKDVLLLLSFSVENRARRHGLRGSGVVLKITYSNMESITRSRMTASSDIAFNVYREASDMLNTIERRPVRLIGAGIYNTSGSKTRQTTLDEIAELGSGRMLMEAALEDLQERYGIDLSDEAAGGYRIESLHGTVEYMRTHRPRTT